MGTSAAVLCLSNLKAVRWFKLVTSLLRDLTRSHRVLKQGPEGCDFRVFYACGMCTVWLSLALLWLYDHNVFAMNMWYICQYMSGYFIGTCAIIKTLIATVPVKWPWMIRTISTGISPPPWKDFACTWHTTIKLVDRADVRRNFKSSLRLQCAIFNHFPRTINSWHGQFVFG